MSASKSTAMSTYVSPRAAMSTAEIKARIEMMFSDNPVLASNQTSARAWA
ncbi:hypothetical protein [Rhodococcus globerulus]|nr:hypothetical protein [Rhodococcus globerulus]